jgi:putative transposase
VPRREIPLSAGLVFHVCNRSAKRTPLFRADDDYALFERVLRVSVARFPVALYAYCVMPNHWHLLVQPRTDDGLGRFMHGLTMRHARRWRDLRASTGEGAVYQGRFRAVPIQCETHFLRACRYVERNPLRANLVGRAELWEWSSLWRRMSHTNVGWLAPWPVAMPADWITYVNSPQSEEEVAAMRTALRTTQPLGDEDWCAATRARLGLAPPVRRGRRVECPQQMTPGAVTDSYT